MARALDPEQLGTLPARDHRNSGKHVPDIDLRYAMRGYRMAARRPVDALPVPVEHGDWQGALFWDRAELEAGAGRRSVDPLNRAGKRPLGSWWWAGAAMGADGKKGTLLPIKSRELDRDLRYAGLRVLPEGKSASPPTAPLKWDSEIRSTTGGRIPGGLPGLVTSGSEEHSQEALFFPTGGVLVAQHLGPHKSEMSSIVYDIDEKGGLHPDLKAGLHTAWRVKRTLAGGAGICWNLAQSGDGSDGFGLCTGRPVDVAVHRGSFSTVMADRQTVAHASFWRGGPFTVGAADDQHHFGRTPDGNPVGPIHLAASALFYAGKGREGPLGFTLAEWEDGSGGAYVKRVELRHNSKATHPYMGPDGVFHAGRGVWMWQSFTDFKKPKPGRPTMITTGGGSGGGSGGGPGPGGGGPGGGRGGGPGGGPPPGGDGGLQIRAEIKFSDKEPLSAIRGLDTRGIEPPVTTEKTRQKLIVPGGRIEDTNATRGAITFTGAFDGRTDAQKRADAERARREQKDRRLSALMQSQSPAARKARAESDRRRREAQEADRKRRRDERIRAQLRQQGAVPSGVLTNEQIEEPQDIDEDLRIGGLLSAGIVGAQGLSTPYEVSMPAISMLAGSVSAGLDFRYRFDRNRRTPDGRREEEVQDARPVCIRIEGWGQTQDEKRHKKNADEVMGTRYASGTTSKGGMIICPPELGLEDLVRGTTTARNLDEAAMSVPHVVMARTTRLSFAKEMVLGSVTDPGGPITGEPVNGFALYRDPSNNLVVETLTALSGGPSATAAIVATTWNNNGNVDFPNNVSIGGKLTVGGLIDPTGLVLDEQAADPAGSKAATQGVIWLGTDGLLHFKDQAGTEFTLDKTAV